MVLRQKVRHALVAGAAVLVGVSGGAVAIAAVPSSDGTISACRSAFGILRVIDADEGERCRRGEEPLSWNQQGPPGPSALPTARTAADAGFVRVTSDDGLQSVLQIELPAGSWALYAKGYVEVFPSDTLMNETTCDLADGTFVFDRSMVRNERANAVVPIALTNVASLPSGGTVELRCSSNVLSFINDTKIVVTAVSP